MATGSHKQEAFAILEVLKKHTDENHRVRQQALIDLIEKETGALYTRRSVRMNLDVLINAGYPIRFRQGWYYEHEFCAVELDLIVDTLRSASGITANQRDELIRKISRLGGEWYAKNDANEQLRPANPQFLYALDILHEAVTQEKKVVFYYGNYGVDKKLHYRCREDGTPRDYLINPYHVLVSNGRYYLLCNVDKYDNLAHFRVERIMDIQLTDQPIKPVWNLENCGNGIDIQRYINDHPYMYNGQVKVHTFQTSVNALNDIFEWFGMETEVKEIDEETIEVTVQADDVSFDYWCRNYGGQWEIK